MKDKILVLLTAEFPFGKSETFIEKEILILAEAVEKIVIIPTGSLNEDVRELPQNVEILNLSNAQVSPKEVLLQILKDKLIFKEFFLNLFSNPLSNKVLIKSLEKGLSISKDLMRFQDENRKHIYYSYWLDESALAIAFLQNDQLKISRAHGWDVYFERHIYNYLPLRKFLAGRLDRIFTISQNGKNYLDSKTKQPEKIRVSRLGTVNEQIFDENARNENLNIISISNIIPLKRINLIGEAIQLINSKKIIWNHFGSGALFEKIKNEFPCGIFYGFVGNDELKSFLKRLSANSILINTSSTEGIPVSMMEAMSFGIPCIGTDVGGVSEIIEDGINGFLMPPNPTAKIASEYIQKYLDLSIKQKREFRTNAFKTWKEKYNAQKNYRDFINEIDLLSV